VGGIAEAIKKSKARVIYNCNLTNKKGQTEDFDVDGYVSEINRHIGKNRINLVTFNGKEIPEKLISKYEKREGKGAMVSLSELKKKRSFTIIKADLLNEKAVKTVKGDQDAKSHSFIRHDSNKLAKVLMMLMEMGDYDNLIHKII
jgi:2-phospho-L-lactate transferase/gluconeogenesis factor (CofD/UPF0052 family)